LGSRRSARILALQALYQIDISEKNTDKVLSFDWLEKNHDASTLDFARTLIEGTLKNLSHIDKRIIRQLEHWDLNRVSFVDRAILRFSTYSLLYQEDVPDTVIINEAIDIAKIFGSDDSYRFVNGVLDGIRKEKRKSENETPGKNS
jgi:N utilization substance protein B